ncbi:MAG: anion permease [Rhodospirillales bacterium]|nr:anion permease [Rhodospirillales bacterium]
MLLLFGGGLALAAAMSKSDLAGWIGIQLSTLGTLPIFLLLLSIGILMVFVGELASNTAMAAVFLPVAAAIAISLGEPAILLTLPVALFATLGFMLPVATPPNAVIFGSGLVKQRDMLRAGIILDLVGIVIVALAIVSLGRLVMFPS